MTHPIMPTMPSFSSTYSTGRPSTSIFSLLKQKISHPSHPDRPIIRGGSIATGSASTFSSDSSFINSFGSLRKKIKNKFRSRRLSKSSDVEYDCDESEEYSCSGALKGCDVRPQSCDFRNSSHRSSLTQQNNEDEAWLNMEGERRRSSASRIFDWFSLQSARGNATEQARDDTEEGRARRDSEIVCYVQYGM